MPKDDPIFSKEYESSSGTELLPVDTVEDTEAPDKKNETEATLPKYGLSKPRRCKIRGKIIRD